MQASAEKIWGSVRNNIQTMVNPDLFRLWFDPIRAKALEHDILTLQVADDFSGVWLEKNYLDLIRDNAILAAGRQLKVRFEASSTENAKTPEPMQKTKARPDAEQTIERSNGHRELQFNPKNTFD